MEEKFLPIGTVVILNGGEKTIMINGYCQKAENNNHIYDYRGCSFPEGIRSSRGVALFDHNDINKIIHLGYKTSESIDFSDKLNIIIENR